VEDPVLQLVLKLALLGHVPDGQHVTADRGVRAPVAVPDLDQEGAPVVARDPP